MKKKRLLFVSVCCLFLLFLFSSVHAQQSLKVSGIVKDTSGVGVPGVSISIKGQTTICGITDNKGEYSVKVPSAKTILVFSSMGFMNAEEKVGNHTKIDVKLVAGTSNLDEVVIIGYGSQKKRDVTGAISSVNSKQIAERQAVDVFDALQGQTPGVQIAQESGAPGSGSSIRIRGTATIEAGANPLYIIDGAQGTSMDGINPNDIESIEVLRDAASAAIYGARSANGVIIITTKRGKDGKARMDFRQTTSFGKLSHHVPQATAAERRLYDLKRGFFAVKNNTVINDSLNPGVNSIDNDYQSLLTRTGVRSQTDLSVSGGGSALNFFGSFSYLQDKGIVINSWSNIARGRFNIDYKANNKITFSTRIQVSYRNENKVSDASVFAPALSRIAYLPIYLPDGSYSPPISGSANPVADAMVRKNNFDIYNGNVYNSISYLFSKDLKFTVDANVTATTTHFLYFNPYVLTVTSAHSDVLSDSMNLATFWQVQGFFNYNKILQKHTLNGVLGVSADNQFASNSFQTGTNLTANESILTMNSTGVKLPSLTYQERVYSESYYARFGDSYLGKYMMNSTFRADGSSRFSPGHRWGYFESVSLGWRFSDEKFFDWSKRYLDDGKFRLSYGVTGNDKVGAYQFLNQYTVGSDYYSNISGIAPSNTLGNPKLSWEVVKQLNLGMDLALLKGRLNIAVDVYRKVTDKLLYHAPLDESTGITNVEVNIGSIQNRGIEFLINGYPYRNKTFTWNVSLNMSLNDNKVLELYQHKPLLTGNPNAWKVAEGGRLGDLYGYKSLGIYAYDVSNAYSSDWQQLSVKVSPNDTSYSLNGQKYGGTINHIKTNGLTLHGGDVNWQNINNVTGLRDSIIDDRDKQILGNAMPKWTGDLINTFTYKQFTFSFNFYISWGNKLYNAMYYNMNILSTTNNTPTPDFIHQSWWHQGDVTVYPKAQLNSGLGNSTNISSLYIEDASFIRLRNVRLTYQIDKSIASKVGLNSVSVFMFANNLALWTKYKGFDPEISMASALSPGYDTGRYPRKKELGLGVNINF